MRRGILIGIAIGGAAILAAVAVAALWASTRPPTAADTVRTYLSALAAGDADAALALTALPAESADRAAEAYAAASEEISDARVTSSREEATRATVLITYSLSGKERRSTLELDADEDRGWRIANGLAALTVTTTIGDAVALAGLTVASGEALPLLPGHYEVEAAPRELVSGSAAVDLEPGAQVEAQIAAELAPEATELAQTQLDAYAEACAQPASTVPDRCGIRVPWAADLATLTRIAFRIERLPAVTLGADGRSFAATGGIIVATATGTSRDGAPGTFTYRADDWALRGAVSVTAEEMVLTVG